jgi:hypothetical protein
MGVTLFRLADLSHSKRHGKTRCMAGPLTNQQRQFVAVIIESGSADIAAKHSGLSTKELDNLTVQRAMRDALAARLLRIAPMALGILEGLAMDQNVPPAVRRLAASDILDRVGLVSQTALQLSKPVESLSEMSARDLRGLVDRLETELFARAKPVTNLEIAPNPKPRAVKPLSILD